VPAVPVIGARAAAMATAAATAAAVVVAEAAFATAKKGKDDWKAEVGPVTKQEFTDMATAGLQKGYDYYIEKYNLVGGELYSLKQAFFGASVFSPFVLAEKSIPHLELLVDCLTHFLFPEFTPKFLAGLKAELPKLKAQAMQAYAWHAVPGAQKYDKDLARRIKREAEKVAASVDGGEAPPDDDELDSDSDDTPRVIRVKDWKEDAIEKARRIWEWWRDRVDFFKFWPTAARLVALVQPSSAVMERVFSQLKLTLETIGYSAREKTVEARMFARENRGIV
jgi:hypothetical protein